MRKLIFYLGVLLISNNLADPPMPNYSFWSQEKYRPRQRLYLLVANNLQSAAQDLSLFEQYFKIFRFRFPDYSAIIPLGLHKNQPAYRSLAKENFLLPLASGDLGQYLATAQFLPVISSNLINIASNQTFLEENFLPYYQILAQDLTATIFSVLPYDASTQPLPLTGIHYLDPVLAIIKHQQELVQLQQKGNFNIVIFHGQHQCQQIHGQQLGCPPGPNPLSNFVKRLAPRSVDLIITQGPINFAGKIENIPILMVDRNQRQLWPIGIEITPPHHIEFFFPVNVCRWVEPSSEGTCAEKSTNRIPANFLGLSLK